MKTRHLKIANVKPEALKPGAEINVQRVISFMASLGLTCELVEIQEEDTEDGLRQCRLCLNMHPLDHYVFVKDYIYKRLRPGDTVGSAAAKSRICSRCRSQHRVSWNRATGGSR